MEEQKQLISVCKAFGLEGPLESWQELLQGHINRTFRLVLGGRVYLAQRLNTDIFQNPRAVMGNIALVTAELRRQDPEGMQLHFLETAPGRNYWDSPEEGFWRLCPFIPSVTYDQGENLGLVEQAGEAFGRFQRQLAGLDPNSLVETIPHFHDTPLRYEALERAAAQDLLGRRAQVERELEALREGRDLACSLSRLAAAGELPLRITHNDTKLNNVLFDPQSGKALCVVDLDTVMPGLLGCDFGDAIRSAANTTAEDDPQPENALASLEVYEAFARGYLSQLGGQLEEAELHSLALGSYCITMEQAARFLTDYLEGDHYFRTARPKHNLERARCQLHLAQDLRQKLPQLEALTLKAFRG